MSKANNNVNNVNNTDKKVNKIFKISTITDVIPVNRWWENPDNHFDFESDDEEKSENSQE